MIKTNLPVLIIKDTALFPTSEIRKDFTTSLEKQLLTSIEVEYQGQVLVVIPNDLLEMDLNINDLPLIGVIGTIKMRMDMPNGKTRVIISGIKRQQVLSYQKREDFYEATVRDIENELIMSKTEIAYMHNLINATGKYVESDPYMSNAVLSQINEVNNLDQLTDIIASYLPISIERKRDYILELDVNKRAMMLLMDITEALDIIDLEKKIDLKVSQQLEASQKEYVLREKIKAIKEELGEKPDRDIELSLLKKKIDELKCPSNIRERLFFELQRYENCNINSPELNGIRDYIDWLLKLPWDNYTKDTFDLSKVKKSLDATHYGLENIKDRIIEYLAVKKKTPNIKTPILCLVGPPGVGKTSLAKSIALSLKRNVAKISVGGINDEAEIVGHRRTYVGACPGKIISQLAKAGSTNPVFIIDEIDKMTKGMKGDPASSLLEVLDPEQNSHFVDHYIDESFDLSNVMFIATANYIDQIPLELRDRLEIITVSSYTEYEKLDIAHKYLIPKALMEHGLTKKDVEFRTSGLLMMIRNYTKEAGVRELERLIATIMRKRVKKMMVDHDDSKIIINTTNLEEYLGLKKYNYLDVDNKGAIGVVNGMAYTPFGGDILPVEATLYRGKGNLILTGSLGKVMKESAHLAFSYIKSHCGEFQIDHELIDNSDIHIHVREGAISKDGPSAGVALTTSLISLLTSRIVPTTISMTGEITLQGKVLPIGGLKEKVIGAHRNRIKKIYLPLLNQPDLEEIPDEIKNDIHFVFVDDYMEIYQDLFVKIDKRQEAFQLF